MTPSNVDIVFDVAVALSPEDREALVARLIDSLEQPEETPLSPAWAAEIQSRIEAFKRGAIKTAPAEEVMRSLSSRKSS